MANLNGVVSLTEAQYATLVQNGTITVGGITINYDANTLYVTDSIEISASDIDSGAATSGQVLTADGSGGATWQNASGGGGTQLYKHTAVLASEQAGEAEIYIYCISLSSTQFTAITDFYDTSGNILGVYVYGTPLTVWEDNGTIKVFAIQDDGTISSITLYTPGTGFVDTVTTL